MDSLNGFAATLESEELITIGPDDFQPTYKVQKQILLDASDYFVKALAGGFREASERRVRLPGEQPETLKLLVHWLCRKNLPDLANELEQLKDDRYEVESEAVSARYLPLVRLWLLGDKLMMPTLQNAAMEEMLKVIECTHTPLEVLQKGYPAAPSDSKLEDLLIMEARYEYFNEDRLDGDDLNVLARMDGFMTDFVNSMEDPRSRDHFSASHVNSVRFMV